MNGVDQFHLKLSSFFSHSFIVGDGETQRESEVAMYVTAIFYTSHRCLLG